jgi:hypothetical protein
MYMYALFVLRYSLDANGLRMYSVEILLVRNRIAQKTFYTSEKYELYGHYLIILMK